MCIYLIHLLSFIYIMGLFVWLFVLVLELLFQALSRYSKILVYTCISTIFCSRTVILQLLVVQVVWFLLQFLCLRCIARSAYVLMLSVVKCRQITSTVINYHVGWTISRYVT